MLVVMIIVTIIRTLQEKKVGINFKKGRDVDNFLFSKTEETDVELV